MRRADASIARVQFLERHLPRSLYRRLEPKLGLGQLATDSAKQWQLQTDALLKSGYLTEASFWMTNKPYSTNNKAQNTVEIARCLEKAARGTYWAFSLTSNQVVLTCRTSDLPVLRHAIVERH
jgi:hypothetical protein